ncbi:helix-turn-helix domain-containing protein [Streptococcus parasanguinis]|jgi:putative cI-like repressor|uniref:Helix-turn-helix domain-containing protein n=1 Tax=Streptococcus parasanguinis TaxID=1318 RepID=A0A943SRZ4_STRPA|nr:helix-turn-helix domain-containing protein [Streptococcus parasanguinis]MBS6536061.1 helix-turn-helix domain-containing protein [Streptococcus parasanguinis]MDO6231145.1 helix-turn-helix domain-containing protein [Streptococcus parasanguinis]
MRKHSTADRLQQLMSEKSLKQVDIIELSKHFQDKLDVKLGKSALSQYVNGIQTPDQKKLALLALTLDVSEAWLMGYDVPKERTYYTNEETPTLSCYTSSDLRKMAENAKTFDGKPLDKEDITAIQNLIEIYLRGR